MDNLKNSDNVLEGFQAIGESNAAVKWVKTLIANTKPNPNRYFVAEGLWLHKLMLEGRVKITALIICREFIKTAELLNIIQLLKTDVKELYEVSAKTFLKISEREKPDGLMSVAAMPVHEISNFKPEKKSTVLIIDGVEIPGNIGTILRMADGAGISAVFICNKKARLTHPKLIKGSQGAVLTVPIFEFDSVSGCYEFLKKNKYSVYLADTRAEKTYYGTLYADRTAIVVGSERYGISREWYDYDIIMISIPMYGKCDSLNVGTAATVLVYEAVKQQRMNNGKIV